MGAATVVVSEWSFCQSLVPNLIGAWVQPGMLHWVDQHVQDMAQLEKHKTCTTGPPTALPAPSAVPAGGVASCCGLGRLSRKLRPFVLGFSFFFGCSSCKGTANEVGICRSHLL